MPKKAIKKLVNTLQSLRMNTKETNGLLNSLVSSQRSFKPVRYTATGGKTIDITLIMLNDGNLFAKISCCAISDIDHPQIFIQNAVEHALKVHHLTHSYKDVAVGGILADLGRLSRVLSFWGQKAPANHAYAAFKSPGESFCVIEDPRPAILSIDEKLQSKFNDQICVFASSIIINFLYKHLISYPKPKLTTKEMIQDIYKDQTLRSLCIKLENKVGNTIQTKKFVISEFIDKLSRHSNPILSAIKEKSIDQDSERLTI